ncbi:MAG TPA: hypothetical protein VMS76_14360 [Planctomycetota bacterium]|nr:hypothetical protein [Planctomycetota bacterium]
MSGSPAIAGRNDASRSPIERQSPSSGSRLGGEPGRLATLSASTMRDVARDLAFALELTR